MLRNKKERKQYGADTFNNESSNNRYGEYLGVCNFISKLEGEAREVTGIEISRIAGNFCIGVEKER